jgi:hypothetical protein
VKNLPSQANARINSHFFSIEKVIKKLPLIALMLAQTEGAATAAELS